MALSAFKGSFAAATATGNQSVTGVGFQPKAVLFWATRLTAAGYGSGLSFFLGAATAADQEWAVTIESDDAAATTNTARRNVADGCVILLAPTTQSVEAVANMVSLDADGFTINWTTAPGSAWLIHYLALGGDTITSAKAGNFTSSASTGNQSITDPNFQPDFLLLASELGGSTNLGSSNALFGFGMASGTSERAALAIRDRDNQVASDVGSIQVSDACFIALNSGGTVGRRADLSSFDATGFTLNWSTASAAVIFYLALAGGDYKVGVETQNTSTGTKVTSGLASIPACLLAAGVNQAASASENTSSMRLSLGAAAGTDEGGVWIQSADAAADSDVDSRTYTDKVIGFSTQASTTNAEADIERLTSASFALDWTTADATAREFIYAAIGPAAAAPYTAPTVAHAVRP